MHSVHTLPVEDFARWCQIIDAFGRALKGDFRHDVLCAYRPDLHDTSGVLHEHSYECGVIQQALEGDLKKVRR